MDKPFYSIGIIFKNEIRCLERCLKSLQSLRDAVPCEVVMADTGSEDGSREIAERYADILFDFPWINDFAAARNSVMDRCSGVWYYSIDADEWMDENVQELIDFYRSRKQKINYDFGGVQIRNYEEQNGETAARYTEFFAIRMVRLSAGLRYVGCIHEHWLNREGGRSLTALTFSKTLMHHDGYCYATKAAQKAKYERNKFLLEKKLAEDPNDLQALIECIDNAKTFDAEASEDYVKRAIEGVNEKRFAWERFGPIVFRDAVCVATLHKLPEMEQWINEGLERFPDSIFVRVDIHYYAFAYYWTKRDYKAAISHGEAYLKGMNDYRTGRYDKSEDMRGLLDNASPYWGGKVFSMLPFAYLECGEIEKAFEGFQKIKAEDIGNLPQIGLCVQTLLHLHRVSMLDTPSLLAEFWDKVAQPDPESEEAAKRRTEIVKDSANAFTSEYMRDEEKETDFQRHSCTIFTALEGKCTLGDAAVIMVTEDPALLEEKVEKFQNLNELPMPVLIHALECGMRFPLPEKPLKIEEMDSLAGRMAKMNESLVRLATLAADGELADLQSLAWARGLALAAVKSYDWSDVSRGMALYESFAKIEQVFLSRYYAKDLLCDENIYVLPPMHRFGWYCYRAFWAKDSGNDANYIHLLRQGLADCPEMKLMVEFLLDQLEESRRAQTTPELLTLAEQVRTLLAQYPADDLAVEALKQSVAYQRVANLIEGPELDIFGGLPQ